MNKVYVVVAYRSAADPAALAAYAKLAAPTVQASGGRFLARGDAARAFEAGLKARTVIIEYDSMEQAVAAYESDAYREALAALGEGVERDVRIVEGLG